MGSASSKSTVEVINESVNSAVAENIQKSSAAGSATQEITVSGSGNKVCKNDMGQELTVRVASEFNNDLAMKTQNDITQKLEAANSASSNMFPSSSSAESNTKVRNLISNSFTMKNIQECLGSVNLNQKINVSGTGNEVCENKMKQAASLVVECIGKNTGVMEAINKTVSDNTVKTSAKNQGLLESLTGGCPDFGFGGAGTCLIVIGVIAVLGLIGYIMMQQSGGDAGEGQMGYPGHGQGSNYGNYGSYGSYGADTISSPDMKLFSNPSGLSRM